MDDETNMTDNMARPAAAAPYEVRDKVFDPVMTARSVSVMYGDKCAVRNVTLDIGRNQVLALIGPSGCAKSTFLRGLNPMNTTIASAKIEDLIDELRENYAITIVTHNMQQAARVSQRTAYFHLGDLVEIGPTDRVFTNPQQKLTEDYITGRFG